MLNTNISLLFGASSQNSNNIMNAFDFSQYASLRNGSYGKLTKAYLNKDINDVIDKKTQTVNKNDKVSSDKKNIDSTGLSQMKREADGLKSAADKLSGEDIWKKTNGKMDTAKIAGAVKDFVKEYNDVVNQSSNVKSKEVASSQRLMSNLTDTMSKVLSKVGVTTDDKGLMTLDEDAFKKADMNVVKSLFEGSYSYGAQIADKAQDISKATMMNSSTYLGNGKANSAITGMFESFI